jgi:hypothetical protein
MGEHDRAGGGPVLSGSTSSHLAIKSCSSLRTANTPKTFSLTRRNKDIYCSFIYPKREIVMIRTAHHIL